MTSKAIIAGGVLLAACLIAATLFASLFMPSIFFWRYTPKTQYAEGFNDTAFSKITNGMSKVDTLAVLGKPLRFFDIDNVSFIVYSDIGHYTSRWEKAFCQRWLAFGRHGTVIHVFNRTITTEDDPTFPVGHWVKDSQGVYQARITDKFKNQ